MMNAKVSGNILVAYGSPMLPPTADEMMSSNINDMVVIYDANYKLEKLGVKLPHLFVIQRKIVPGKALGIFEGALGFTHPFGIVLLADKIEIKDDCIYPTLRSFISFNGVGKIVSPISRDHRQWHNFIIHVSGVFSDMGYMVIELEYVKLCDFC